MKNGTVFFSEQTQDKVTLPSLHLKPYHYHLLVSTILMETCSMITKSKCSLPALAKELGYYACAAKIHTVCL